VVALTPPPMRGPPRGPAVSESISVRRRSLNDAPIRERARYVLYWMTAARRLQWNFALERTVALAKEMKKPLVIVETLDCGRRWDSDRLHRFVLEGMADNAAAAKQSRVLYYPYVGASPQEACDLVLALAEEAAVVVADDSPIDLAATSLAAVARAAPVRVEAVDSNGLLPLRAAPRVFSTAYAFRRFLQKESPSHLNQAPRPDPLARVRLPGPPHLPREVTDRWPKADARLLRGEARALAVLPIDHSVSPAETPGGARAAEAALRRFVRERLSRYAVERNEPEKEATSGLSPYLHHGHISAHQVFEEVMEAEGWSEADLSEKATGSRAGWWGVSESAEAFLDQLVTWRELGFNMAWQRPGYDRYESLPEWARETLADHASDMRPHLYSPEQLEAGATPDRLWNAAQMQLAREGRLHNYLRMLWGKKILEWTPAPEEAAEIMIDFNNRYALDGRGPNSYTGIFWVLGRYDRPWGPERPIFGKIRYMSSENTARKIGVRRYVEKYAP
jgi:deoxyribodipyrimidine photo-lyase